AETAVEAAAQSQDGDEGGTVPASTMPQQESPEEESTSPAPGSADAVPPNGQDPSDERPRRGRRRGPQFDRSDENVDAYTRESRSLLRALSPAVEGVSTSIAVIYVDHLPVVLGTVIDPDGTILTKRSELPEDGEGIMVTMPDGLMVSGTVVAVRHDEDLALVSTGEGEQDAINFLVPLADASLDEGEIILSPGPDGMPKAMGVIALRDRTTTRRDVTSAFLGVGVRESTKQELASAGVSQAVTIWTLTRGSPAEACGLKQGDLLVSVDGTAIPSQVVLGEVVRRHAVGEAMKISLVRDGKPMECVIRGAVRSRESGPPASTTDAPASRRPSGFGSVIQHDSVMGSSEMGGPLVDLDGRVLGLNIARVDRTRTYALSRERVAQAIKGMRDDIAAGKDPIQPTALMVALEVHVEGETSLNAAAAQPRGGQLLYATPERGTEGSVAGFATPGDTLSWRVVVPEAMRVQIDLRYSLPGDRQGPDERVAVEVKDGDSTEAPLRKTVRGRYVRKLIGDLNLPAGESTIQLRVLDAPATLSVRSLILTPVQSAVPEAPKEE
ncbi:MAG: PDZ domain-containing protein, partial [Planctomycetota bacterium]|nr:PDZ domain-containing protein [Planctomycetota bacterium]